MWPNQWKVILLLSLIIFSFFFVIMTVYSIHPIRPAMFSIVLNLTAFKLYENIGIIRCKSAIIEILYGENRNRNWIYFFAVKLCNYGTGY